MSIKSEKAAELFKSGFNCSQSVLAVFSEKFGMSQAQALKTACGFGSGMRCGEVCGAVSGAIMTIGLKYGQYIVGDKESKSRCYAETEKFEENFRNENSSIICREILGCDLSTDAGKEQASARNLFKTICVDKVISAVKILEDMGF